MPSTARMKNYLINTVIAVASLWLAPANGSQCPLQCMCMPNQVTKGTIQPIRAECNNIPSELPLSVTSLKVSASLVPNITQDLLSGVISQLLNVKLESLYIEYIEDGAFQNALNLKRLWLSKNRLKAITVKTFASCKNITDLYLEENELYYIEDGAFTTLLHLKQLFMQKNKLRQLPSNLPPNLLILDLSENEIGPYVTNISKLTHLMQLKLCGNPIQEISLNMLKSLGSLENLCLGGDGFVLPPSTAKHLPLLEELALTTTVETQLDQTTMQELAEMTSIKILKISNYIIPSFKFLYQLTDIRKIQLTNVTISSEAGRNFVDALPILNNIANIVLDRSPQLARVFIENGQKLTLPKLNTLSLTSSGLTSIHPVGILHRNLPYLDISGNPFHCNCSLEWLRAAHDLQNTQDTLCATPEENRDTPLITFVQELNCTTDDLALDNMGGTHSSSHNHDEDESEDSTTNIIIGCIIALLVIATIILAVIYVLYKKRRCHKITPDTQLHDRQQQAQISIQQAHSNDHLLKK